MDSYTRSTNCCFSRGILGIGIVKACFLTEQAAKPIASSVLIPFFPLLHPLSIASWKIRPSQDLYVHWRDERVHQATLAFEVGNQK